METSAAALMAALAARCPGGVRPATADDAVAGVVPRIVVAPADEDSLAAVLAFADGEGLAVLPRGGGTQLGMGFPPRAGDLILSLERMRRVIEHAPADQTVTVQAGIPLSDLQAVLATSNQWLALDPDLPPAATIAGVLSTNASGPRRLRYGGARDLLIGIRVALADGTLAKGGGKVVKNVAGYDLPKLYVGALGTLGVITAATFRLHPLPSARRAVVLSSADLDALGTLATRIRASTLTPTLITLASPESPAAPYTLEVRFESSVAAAVEEQAEVVLALAAGILGIAARDGQNASNTTPPSLPHDALPIAPHSLAREGGRGVRLKASLPLTDIVPWLTQLEEIAAAHTLTASWRAHAGHGLVHAHLAGPDAALLEAIETLRTAALARQGSLLIENAPPTLAARLDIWGPSPALALMRRLKAQFDPHNTLNPGRFLGRI